MSAIVSFLGFLHPFQDATTAGPRRIQDATTAGPRRITTAAGQQHYCRPASAYVGAGVTVLDILWPGWNRTTVLASRFSYGETVETEVYLLISRVFLLLLLLLLQPYCEFACSDSDSEGIAEAPNSLTASAR
eukprot:COSAG01_NODE_3134_length_6530_cov_80.581092_4_plen_132_part_00